MWISYAVSDREVENRCPNPAVRTVQKEVINCCDCKKLGYIDDLIIDDCKGCIEALVVPEGGKWCNFFGDGTEYIIPFPASKESALI